MTEEAEDCEGHKTRSATLEDEEGDACGGRGVLEDGRPRQSFLEADEQPVHQAEPVAVAAGAAGSPDTATPAATGDQTQLQSWSEEEGKADSPGVE